MAERVLASRLVEALTNTPTHTENFKHFDEGLAVVFGRDVLDIWLQEIKAWEADFTQLCLYEGSSGSQQSITEIQAWSSSVGLVYPHRIPELVAYHKLIIELF